MMSVRSPLSMMTALPQPRRQRVRLTVLILLSLAAGAVPAAQTPRSPVSMARPPRGAVVLFAGKDSSGWMQLNDKGPCQWKVEEGALVVAPGTGNILTKQKFGDFQLHVEYNLPDMPDQHSQGRANSGVYLHGLYEIQVLDSFNNETYANGMCGAIYGQKPPDINACKPAGQWQTYDILFRAPRFDTTGKVTANPRVSVRHNGILIHDDVEITVGPTTASLGGPMTATGPIMLQDHGAAVKFRNIWIKPRPQGKAIPHIDGIE